MFEDINEYMKKSQEERQAHLELEDDCIVIGTDSRICRGLLAHHLKTTMGTRRVYCCHACHNAECSNPNHLYWGTPKENYIDAINDGTVTSFYENAVRKYGEKEFKQICSERIKNSITRRREQGLPVGGATRAYPKEQIEEYKNAIHESEPMKWGWVSRAAERIGVSHTQIKRFVKNRMPDLEFYQRKSPGV